jgi:hypothetical protein
VVDGTRGGGSAPIAGWSSSRPCVLSAFLGDLAARPGDQGDVGDEPLDELVRVVEVALVVQVLVVAPVPDVGEPAPGLPLQVAADALHSSGELGPPARLALAQRRELGMALSRLGP